MGIRGGVFAAAIVPLFGREIIRGHLPDRADPLATDGRGFMDGSGRGGRDLIAESRRFSSISSSQAQTLMFVFSFKKDNV